MSYVDRDVVKNTLSCTVYLHQELPMLIDSIPAANVRPVVRGKWIPYSIKDCLYYCSNCNALPTTKTNYCPNCGAKMEVEESET